jgi:hypothetical protein
MLHWLQFSTAGVNAKKVQWRPELPDNCCIAINQIKLDLYIPSQDNTTSDGFAFVIDHPVRTEAELDFYYPTVVPTLQPHLLAYTHQRTSARGTSGYYGDFSRVIDYEFRTPWRCFMLSLAGYSSSAGFFQLVTARVDWDVVKLNQADFNMLLMKHPFLVQSQSPHTETYWP